MYFIHIACSERTLQLMLRAPFHHQRTPHPALQHTHKDTLTHTNTPHRTTFGAKKTSADKAAKERHQRAHASSDTARYNFLIRDSNTRQHM